MIKRSNTSRVVLTALMATMAGVGALGGVAHAEDDRPTPSAPKGCTYAGADYSNGSTRQQVKRYSNGTTVYENYECRNGSWVYTGASRVQGSSAPAVTMADRVAPPRA